MHAYFLSSSVFDPKSGAAASDMDLNPNQFPILSYVMDKLPTIKRTLSTAVEAFDIENPHEIEEPEKEPRFELSEKMPHLKKPELISAMRRAVHEIAQTRSILHTLGPRPDHEVVDAARYKMGEMESQMGESSKQNTDYRKYKAVIALDEMHETYGKMLSSVEKRLERIYEAAVAGSDLVEEEKMKNGGEVKEEEIMREEVVGILKDAELGKGIQMVDLAGKSLKMLPQGFWRLRSMVVLNLSDNQIEEIAATIKELENLEELNLSGNLLESLPDAIGLLYKLRILNVSKNNLTALPDSITNCRALEDVDASYNKLTYLPTNIGFELLNLKRLSIEMNKIRSLPTSIGWMKSLCILDAHFNELRGLPISIGRLTSLEVLNLNSNFSDLKELPETISQLTNLRELDLSHNQIQTLPATFGHLLNLRKLNLDENPLKVPPKQVVTLGVDVIRVYMNQRLAAMVKAEEEKYMHEQEEQAQEQNLLTRSTSWLKDVSGNLAQYLGSIGKTDADRYLNQEF